jgi:integrase
MATVFKKTFTKPMPQGAELFIRKSEQFARWKDAKGKTRTEKITTGKDGLPRLLIEAKTHTAKYRDGSGHVREVATGCHDETAARQVLADLVKRCELVKGKILTAAQDAVIDHQATPLVGHIVAYVEHMSAKGVTAGRIAQTESRLLRICKDCEFTQLANLGAAALERWLSDRAAEDMSAAARNGYRSACVAFGNWCVQSKRLVINPLAGIPKANEKADPRRHRRAMTEVELVKLLDVTRRRPLLDAMTIHRGEHKGEVTAKLKPGNVSRLEMLGRERALIYKTLVLTGLRKGELASLTVGQLELDGPTPCALLHASDEKNRQGSKIPLRDDLAADLRDWLVDNLINAQAQAIKNVEAIPAHLPDDMPLFNVPAGLVRILDRDLAMAGIKKRDGRGWTIDVHAMRHTFGTLLSKGGVAPRTAQAAMRHSSIDLTMNVYTDPRLLDIAGAMQSLPSLSLKSKPVAQCQQMNGTYAAGSLAPTLAPTFDNPCKSLSIADKNASGTTWMDSRADIKNSLENQGFRQPSTTTDKQQQTGRRWARTNDLILVRDAL